MSMTAQAGAVGYIRDDGLQVLNEGRLNIALWASPSYGVSTPVYLAPPAAVPVEALEGLVARWRAGVELCKQHEVPQEVIDSFEQCADELTTLIKERSNG